MAKKPKWQIRMGPTEWMRYTYARPPGDPVELLGSVKRGMQVGALALIEGKYFQLIGDHAVALNSAQVARAVASAPAPAGENAYGMAQVQRAATATTAPPPKVIIKRRRVFTMPTESVAA